MVWPLKNHTTCSQLSSSSSSSSCYKMLLWCLFITYKLRSCKMFSLMWQWFLRKWTSKVWYLKLSFTAENLSSLIFRSLQYHNYILFVVPIHQNIFVMEIHPQQVEIIYFTKVLYLQECSVCLLILNIILHWNKVVFLNNLPQWD